ncbi:MAG TPA: hypothetical protein VJ110_00590 [Candidatus Nanoarchaeia archaeon]|nr:hypothetical protein [Candidatus Nanoarchaeia archaeon]
MPLTLREAREKSKIFLDQLNKFSLASPGSKPYVLTDELAEKLLPQARDIDFSKDPSLEFMIALYLYPGSTKGELLEYDWKFGKTWEKYMPGLVKKGFVKESRYGEYSLTKQGENEILEKYFA